MIKSLTSYIYEGNDVKMSPAKVSEYAKLIEEYKKAITEHGLELHKDKNDSTGTLWIASEDTDALENFIYAGDAIFRGLKEEKWPLPYVGCDAHVDDDFVEIPVLYFCMWLNLGPCENPQEQWKVAKECYDEDDEIMQSLWKEHGFDNPDVYIDALIGQVKDIMKIFPKFEEYMSSEE